MEWDDCLEDGVLINEMGHYLPECVVSLRDEVFVWRLGCLYMGWSVSIRDGVLLSGMGC